MRLILKLVPVCVTNNPLGLGPVPAAYVIKVSMLDPVGIKTS